MPGPNDSGSKPAEPAGHDGSGSSDLLSAADEPTAMWDEASLREAGFQQVAAQAEAQEARTNPAPPTSQEAGAGPSIVIDHMPDAGAVMRSAGTPVRASPMIVPAKKRSATGLSWPLTIGLAAALGTFVYLIVRFLK